MSQQKTLDTIRKLLAKANDSSATPEEAAAFATKASQMLIDAGLTEEALEDKTADVGVRVWKARYAEDKWLRWVMVSASPVFMCQLLLVKYSKIIKSRSTGENKLVTKTAFQLVGRPERTAVLEDVGQYLYTTIVRLAREHSPVRREQLSFMRGAGVAVSQRFDELHKARQKAAQDATAAPSAAPDATPAGLLAGSSDLGSRALVLVSTALTEVEDYIDTVIKPRAARKSTPIKGGSGFGAGYAAGEKINLGDQIEHNKPAGALE